MKCSTLSRACLAFLLVLVAASIAAASPVIINFDDLANGAVITTQYAEATFSSNQRSVNYVTTQSSFNGTKPNFLCTGPANGSITCSEPTLVNFTDPVRNLTFQGMGINDTGLIAQVDVFSNGAYVSTVDIIGNSESYNPLLIDLTAFSNVTSIDIKNITDHAGIGWDTFSFDQSTSTVPEPASLLLLGAGLGAIALSSLRKKK